MAIYLHWLHKAFVEECLAAGAATGGERAGFAGKRGAKGKARAAREAKTKAKAELKKAGVSGVSGHTHRLGTYRAVGYGATQWTEQGCMCLLEPDYIVGPPNWTQGIAVGEFATRRESFVVHEVPFIDGTLRLGMESF